MRQGKAAQGITVEQPADPQAVGERDRAATGGLRGGRWEGERGQRRAREHSIKASHTQSSLLSKEKEGERKLDWKKRRASGLQSHTHTVAGESERSWPRVIAGERQTERWSQVSRAQAEQIAKALQSSPLLLLLRHREFSS
ncbi:connector enhancer of kinase suppressor of ras 3 [Platysternon megacephalum]|uniref:Connector enhancer of kinase suppressor of ras 3 n=1 Tax=Platysternon megacephalum TaxID=55544 RepID=A0A4D9EBL0_9SAUR|nr:connector enhancer of kinase suppressor of ras 3 [Platysternon megacephalum]